MSDSRPTLLILTPHPLLEGGGLESYVRNLIGGLIDDHGWRVVLVTTGPRGSGVQCEDVGDLRVYRLPYQVQVYNTRFSLAWRRQLEKIIRDEKPDLVNAHTPTPGLADVAASVTGRVPLVVTYHAGSMHKGRWPADLFISLYEKVLCRRLLGRAAWVISSSDFVRDSFLVRVRAKCTTVTPGVDVGSFTPGPTRPRGRVLFVGGLGRADSHKGLDRLLHSFASLVEDRRDLRLDVVGSGDAQGHYHELSRALGVDGRVRFLGRLAGAELVEAYRSATVLALATTNDSFPMVLLEAMACRVPVVSTRVGGIPSLVDDGQDGFLVDAEDMAGFTERLGRILDDPDLAARMGEAGRDKVTRRYTWAGQTARTDTILEAVAAGRPGHGRHRLAVVAPRFRPTIGGLEEYAYQIALGFNERADYDVIVLTSNHVGHRTVVEVLDGLTVFRFPKWFTVSQTPVNPLWPWYLRRAMSDNRIDVVDAHTPVPFMVEAAALACDGRPLVVTYHAGSMLKGKWLPDLLIRPYERWVLPWILRRADAVVSVSPAVSSRLRTRLARPSFLVRPGVDGQAFAPAPNGNHRIGAPTLLYVGRIDRGSAWKGIDQLLQAFAIVLMDLPDTRLVLVGGGDAVEDHQALAASLGIADHVEFRGILRDEALLHAYQEATALVLPSTTEAEASPMVLIEAMACRTPVIASNVGGVSFVVDDGVDGRLVPPAEPERLAAACVELLRSPTLAAGMGRNGWQKVQALSWPSRVAEHLTIFRRLLGEDSR